MRDCLIEIEFRNSIQRFPSVRSILAYRSALCHNRETMSLADRHHARAEVSFEAILSAGGKTGDCRIQNISADGAQVTSRMPVSRGDSVVLGIGIKFASDIDTTGDLLMAFAIY